MPETAIGCAGLGLLVVAQLLYRWISSRTQVQLVRLRQQGTSERVRALPAGSVLTERRAGEELRIEMGASEGGGHG
ncbi:hypothetical protein [Streptomyces sp. NPDC052496]|uniref:hypothetical protein n=1 Tax=Streptomyces sp. NPDC052496 TaxID=3154951 RepID=UPI0034480C7C